MPEIDINGESQAESFAAQRLQHRYAMLANRAGKPLTPHNLAALERAGETLEFQNSLHSQRYGKEAITAPDLMRLRRSMGTENTAFAVSEILRKGNMGQARGLNHDWKALVRIERELNRIDKTLQKESHFAQSPSSQASLQRQKDSIYREHIVSAGSPGYLPAAAASGSATRPGAPQTASEAAEQQQETPAQISLRQQHEALRVARARIARGLAGNTKRQNRLGHAYGLMGILADEGLLSLVDPAVGAVVAGATVALSAPYLARKTEAGILGLGKPYRDFRISEARIAAAGGFNTNQLQSKMLVGGWRVADLGNGITQSLLNYGLSPQEAVRIAQARGVPFRGPRQARKAVNFAESARLASMAPGMNLSETQLAGLAGQAQTLTYGGINNQRYWRTLQKVMSEATMQGVDSSRLAEGWSRLISASSAGLGSPNIRGDANFMARMIGSGAPSMRSGEREANMMKDFNKTMSHLPQHAASVIGLATLFPHGAPMTAAGLQAGLGISKRVWNTSIVSTPAAANDLRLYLDAARRGDAYGAMTYLGLLLKGHMRVAMHAFKKTPLYRSASPELRYRFLSAMLGVPLSGLVAHGSTGKYEVASTGALAPLSTKTEYDVIRQEARRAGVPLANALAVAGKESSFNAMARNAHHRGLYQVSQGVLNDYNKAHGTHLTWREMYNVRDNAKVGLWYYAKQLKATAGAGGFAYERYHWGPNSGKVVASDLAKYESYYNQFSNTTSAFSVMRKQASRQGLELQAAHAASLPGNALVGGSQVASRLISDLGTLSGASVILQKGFTDLGKVTSGLEGEFKRLEKTLASHLHNGRAQLLHEHMGSVK